MWLRGKKKLKSLIRFHCANKSFNYNGVGEKMEKRDKGTPKNLQNKSKHENDKCFSWVTAVRILSLAGSHSPPHLPRMPSNTVLISGPAVGAAQILIWSYSCMFLPPMSTAIRASAFSFVGKCLYSWVGRFWVFFLSHTALGFNCGFISTSTCGSPTGAAPEAVLEDLGLPLWGVEVVQLLGLQGFW